MVSTYSLQTLAIGTKSIASAWSTLPPQPFPKALAKLLPTRIQQYARADLFGCDILLQGGGTSLDGLLKVLSWIHPAILYFNKNSARLSEWFTSTSHFKHVLFSMIYSVKGVAKLKDSDDSLFS